MHKRKLTDDPLRHALPRSFMGKLEGDWPVFPAAAAVAL